MKINEVTTPSRTLKENDQVAELGRAMMDMAAKHKDDEVSNALSSVGDALTRFGTNLGPKSLEEVVKQTGVQAKTIQKFMAAAQKHVEKTGPVRSGAGQGDDMDSGEEY